MSAPPYGAKVDSADVSYEPQQVVAGQVQQGYYYLVDDPKTRVVWVNPSNQESVAPNGFFALYDGPPEEYAAVVKEAA